MGLYDQGADWCCRRDLGLQSSPEPDRAPGGTSDRHRLPGDREACCRNAALLQGVRFCCSPRRVRRCRAKRCSGPHLHLRLHEAGRSDRGRQQSARRFPGEIFTQAIDPALRAAERLDASAVMVNDHTAFRTDWMPFAGRRQSGYGIGGIPWSMREMTQEKMVVLRRNL